MFVGKSKYFLPTKCEMGLLWLDDDVVCFSQSQLTNAKLALTIMHYLTWAWGGAFQMKSFLQDAFYNFY